MFWKDIDMMSRLYNAFVAASGIIGQKSRILFICTAIVFISIRLSTFIIPLSARNFLPIEQDDAYFYLLRAAQLERDFFQQSLALKDLRYEFSMSSPANSPHKRYQQLRIAMSHFFIYTPLHSAIIVIFHKSGISWISSYNCAQIFGIIFITTGLITLLYSLFATRAWLPLLWLSVYIFPGHGIYYPVASNYAAGLTAWTLGLAIIYPARRNILLAIILPMLPLMHSIGIAYVALILFWFFFTINRSFQAKLQLLAYGCTYIAFYLIMPHIVHTPCLTMPNYPLPEEWMDWSGIIINLKAILHQFKETAECFGGIFLMLTILPAFAFFGLKSLQPERLRDWSTLMAGIVGLEIVSIGHIAVYYPAEAFSRFAVILTPLFSGLIGAGAVQQLESFSIDQPEGKPHKTWSTSDIINNCPHGTILRFCLVVAICIFTFCHFRRGIGITLSRMRKSIIRSNFQFNAEQPVQLLTHTNEKDLIMYSNLMAEWFYLIHGADRRGAWLVHPLFDGKPKLSNRMVRFGVSFNPMVKLFAKNKLYRGSGFLLTAEYELKFKLPANSRNNTKYELRIQCASPESTLLVRCKNSNSPLKPKNTTSPNRNGEITEKWLTFALVGDNEFKISAVRGAPCKITGLRFDRNGNLRWPWKDNVTFTVVHKTRGVIGTVNFAHFSPFKGKGFTVDRVISDCGVGVLMSLRRIMHEEIKP